MNAIDEIYQTIKLLLESEITAYQIEKKTGVSRAKIGRLKDGKNELSNLSLGTTEKLYYFQKEIEKNEKYKNIRS